MVFSDRRSCQKRSTAWRPLCTPFQVCLPRMVCQTLRKYGMNLAEFCCFWRASPHPGWPGPPDSGDSSTTSRSDHISRGCPTAFHRWILQMTNVEQLK